jgi:thiol-disulfide isomerase/thioredoxin
MHARRWAALAGVVAIIAAVAGFAVRSLYLDNAKAPPPTAASADTLARATFPDLTGKAQRLDQWRGKVLVMNFWATWCPPCLKEIPEFIRMQARYGDRGLQFVGVAVDQQEKVAAFADRIAFNYPVLVGALDAVELLRALGNQHGSLPFTVIFDRSGAIVAAELGALDEPKLMRLVEPLL